MIRARHWLAIGLAVVPALGTGASEADSARNDAQNGTASLERRPCPALGDRKYLGGMTEPQQLVAAADKERSYQEGALRQLQQLVRDPKLEGQQRTDLQALASWSIAASMANWSMLSMAQQALANPLIGVGQPYPTSVIDSARERVRQTAANGAVSPDAAGAMNRQAAALDRCAKSFNTAIFKLNLLQFEAAIDSAKSVAELDRVDQQYHGRDAVTGGYGADSADKLAARRIALAEADRVAREGANAANAADAAKRQADAQKRQAEIRAKLPTYLGVAKRFADASASHNERAALAELSQDVVMTTPQGSYRGIDQVGAALRQQASGQGASLGSPRIDGERVMANGSAQGYRIVTMFSFDGSDKISRIDVSL